MGKTPVKLNPAFIEENAKLMKDVAINEVTIEDIARAWASIDGKIKKFDACKSDNKLDEEDGYFQGYLYDAQELMERSVKYAKERILDHNG